jgi:YNFM family putative membrane transporter
MKRATVTSSELRLRPYSQVFAPFLCGMFAFIDLYCTQPLLPLLSSVFHASEPKVSLTISASTLGVAFSAAMLALFAERVNRKRMILASMIVLACSTLLTATATSLPALAIWRLLQGLVTVGGILPGLLWKHGGWRACVALVIGILLIAGSAAVFGWRLRPVTPDPIPL